ncbi:MAG: AMP-binding protein, partial [Lachnospiraceae bacterium]|nr:AMP-binding protein [Lachnospiraceae bacterium]
DAVVLEPDADGYGELAVKGDLVFCGYYGDEAATAKMFSKDGYFLTGDIGTIRNKKVYLKGRKDARLSLPNGETISIPALEAKIKALRENVTAVKIYLRDDLLTADLYVKPVELAEDQALWATLMEQLNQSLAVFERIGQYHVYGADQLHVKLVAE